MWAIYDTRTYSVVYASADKGEACTYFRKMRNKLNNKNTDEVKYFEMIKAAKLRTFKILKGLYVGSI